MPLHNPEQVTATPKRARNLRATNKTGCLEFNPSDGPRFLNSHRNGDGVHASPRPGCHPSKAVQEKTEPAKSPAISDEVLVERCKAELPQNLEAYEELVRRHEARVLSTCVAMIGNRPDAEEICQDTFVQVFRKIHQFEGRSSFKTWLFRIAYNMCLSRRRSLARRRDREATVAEEVKVRESAILADFGIDDLCEGIEKALSRLDDKERSIVALRFVSGLSHEEIAEKLNLKLSAAKMRFYRALDEFKAAYLEITGNTLAA